MVNPRADGGKCRHGRGGEPRKKRIGHRAWPARRKKQAKIAELRIHPNERAQIIGDVAHLAANFEDPFPRFFTDPNSVVAIVEERRNRPLGNACGPGDLRHGDRFLEIAEFPGRLALATAGVASNQRLSLVLRIHTPPTKPCEVKLDKVKAEPR